ncbi:hypothetical protein H2203_000183 [Taxawa tesnikishii (nom. ined.)]|nr:hypothetical protein H2203_000183 [Dothideales sp. JES 119]
MRILITGAASGLGKAFVEAFGRDNNNNHIIAIDKSRDFSTNSQCPAVVECLAGTDVTDDRSMRALAGSKSVIDQPIDLVIHSAGIRGLVPAAEDAQPDSVAAAETMHVMDMDTLMRTFQVNAAGTFLLLRTVLPNLKLSRHEGRQPKVIIMSSRMGSVGANTGGSAYAYRASKAALNAIVKSFSIDVPEVTFILCHPGRVETKLVRYKEEGAISAEESVRGLLTLIEKWGERDSGKFFDRFGEPIQW